VLIHQAVVGTPCAVEDQCDVGECCQILSEFMVVSKKRAAADCDSPMAEGSGCGTFDKMNGYCSCEPGTYCHVYEIPITTGRSARAQVMPRPGYQWISRCEKRVSGG
ncbi:unnamed protein product, partial [Lymnaea stagnalis]